MANRLDYFFRQLLTESELDEGFDKMEAADQKIMTDQLLSGIFIGGEVAEHFPAPDLTVDIAGPMNAYDQLGRRLFFSVLQVLDMSVDELSVSTAVGTPGNEKILTIFIQFDRNLSDPRLDGNNNTVFFQRAESFKLNVVQSAEAAIGFAVPPAPRVDQLILADITIINAQTQILDADIDASRRADVFIDQNPTLGELREGRFIDVINKIRNDIESAVAVSPKTHIYGVSAVVNETGFAQSGGSQFAATTAGDLAHFTLDRMRPGEKLNSLECFVKDNVTGPTKIAVTLDEYNMVTGAFAGLGLSAVSDGSGNRQTLSIPSLPRTLPADTLFTVAIEITDVAGSIARWEGARAIIAKP